jgi:Ni,Fe-hydrogenase I small subunit
MKSPNTVFLCEKAFILDHCPRPLLAWQKLFHGDCQRRPLPKSAAEMARAGLER